MDSGSKILMASGGGIAKHKIWENLIKLLVHSINPWTLHATEICFASVSCYGEHFVFLKIGSVLNPWLARGGSWLLRRMPKNGNPPSLGLDALVVC